MDTTLTSEEYMKRMANGELIDFRDLPNRYHISRIAQEELNRAIKEKSDKDYLEAKKFLEASNISNLDINASILVPAPNLLPPLPRSKYEVNITLLKEILVRDLELKRNEGYYFRGKVIMKPWKMPGPSCAVNTLVEDKTGDIARINCYNVLATEDWGRFEKIFSIGREVIILHPFFKQTKDGLVSIRVENRYEFYFGDEAPETQLDFEALLEKSKTFKDEGNQELKTNINSALEKYHKSLEVFLKRRPKLVNEKDDFLLEWTLILDENQKNQALNHLSIVFSNCSLIYIEKSQPLRALHYAKFSVWCNEKFFKGKLRMAKALIDLLYVFEAEELLNDLKSQNPTPQFKEEIDKLSNELTQTIKEYTSSNILVKFLRNELNWPEDRAYVGPMKLFTTEGKGRNFMARRDIEKGEILLMEKGFVCHKENPDFSYQLINRLDSREDLKMLYMNLFPSSRIPIHKALKESSEEKMKEYTLRTEFDVFWREHPRNWENFSNNEISELLAKSRYNSYKSNGRPALFPFMCLINHSCDPNTSVWYAGDMVLILAQRNIRKGEEIFVTYIPLSDNKFQRRSALLNYGFDCDCTRCEEKQGWKQKGPKLDGVRCPKCFIEIASNSDGKFICPKGCWEGDFSYFEDLDKKFTALLPQIKDWAEKQQHSQLENYLKTIEKQFSEYHRNKEIVLYDLARSYAISRDEKNFKKWFLEIIKMIEFHALPELRMILNSLLVEIINNFEREPTEEELEYFSLFGLNKEAIMGLWHEYMKTGDIEWFLPFELRD